MPMIRLILDEELRDPDLTDKLAQDKVVHLTGDFAIARLSHGMKSGSTSLMIRIDLPDGRVVLQETSLACFLAAARGLEAAEHRN